MEEKAASYLKDRGMEILERNYRKRSGEIDIIAKEGGTIAFIEVKYRNSIASGKPYEAVDYRKRQRIATTAVWYIKERGLLGLDFRFDIVELEKSRITHRRNAFRPPERFGV